MDLKAHLLKLQKHFEWLVHDLSAPDATANPARFQEMSREHARLSPLVEKFKTYQKLKSEQADLQALVQGADSGLRHMAEEDLTRVCQTLVDLEKELQLALLPRDPNEDRNIILEIRAGAGGDEAGLFAADLLRMYSKYAEKRGWTLEPIDLSSNEKGGIKEVIAQISGKEVWRHLKFESGVHRVQRVPTTEANGRIHTSTATVAVLPEAEEVDLKIDPTELRIDTYRAHGAGGQHINKTESAVRITHLPTGLVVTCQDQRSQLKNRDKAMTILRSRLLQVLQEKQHEEMSQARRNQVGTGDRSEKIRTYNYPQDRITDHRINFNMHDLPSVMEGELDTLTQELQKHEQARLVADLSKSEENPS